MRLRKTRGGGVPPVLGNEEMIATHECNVTGASSDHILKMPCIIDWRKHVID